MAKCYEVLFEGCLENFPNLVIEHEGVYYPFGFTTRTHQSIWNQVKGNLGDLPEKVVLTDEDVVQLQPYLRGEVF